MVKWENIVIHHSASEFGCARIITEWHKERGWKDIGYHFVIQNGCPYSFWKQPIYPIVGSVEMGRPIDSDEWVQGNEVGAHALGFNKNSIGICLIHNKESYGIEQIRSLAELCLFLQFKFHIKTKNVVGHYEVDKGKPLCPSIDMDKFRRLLDEEITIADFMYGKKGV